MPDHLHILLLGLSDDADPYLAMRFVRKHSEPHLLPAHYQKQAYDHVLTDEEMERGVFETMCFYIAENPVREKLCEAAADYEFTGAVIPGYPDLGVHSGKDWELFWKICEKESMRLQSQLEAVTKTRPPS
jgi:hypothetical protein